jgi:cytoskeleton protein RodZ
MSPPEAEITELPSSAGARLRREREGRGMSPQQAAEALNLDPVILGQLEANDFGALGAPVFVKGHLRRYAALLGLGEDEVLAMYERSKQQLGEPSLVPKSRLEMAPVRGKPRWPWVLGGAVSFLIASALIAYLSENGLPWVAQQAEEDAGVTQESSVASGNRMDGTAQSATGGTAGGPVAAGQGAATVPAAAVGSGENSSSAPFSSEAGLPADSAAAATGGATSGTAAAPANAALPALAPGQVSLQLRFTADSWVEVFDGSGKAVLYDLGKAGSERTITAMAPVSVTLGDARGVGVSVNGRALPPPSRAAGETLARFSIGADGNLR